MYNLINPLFEKTLVYILNFSFKLKLLKIKTLDDISFKRKLEISTVDNVLQLFFPQEFLPNL